MLPDYFKKTLNGAVLLAPPASMYNNPSKIIRLLSHPIVMEWLEGLVKKFNLYEWGAWNHTFAFATSTLCDALGQEGCAWFWSNIVGINVATNNLERASFFLSEVPCGSNALTDKHYGQLIHSSEPAFKRYDLGTLENLARYN